MPPTTSDSTLAPELGALQVHGMTRSAFLMRGALAAGAVYGTATVGPFVEQALAQGGDVEILNFALTLEALEAEFYEKALAEVRGLSEHVKTLAEEIGHNEREHVEALTQTIGKLGGSPAPAPETKFDFSDEEAFLKLATSLEDTGVGAYNGAGPRIQSKEVLAAAGSIVQVEARHAAAIRMAAGEEIAPKAFDSGEEEKKVLEEIDPFVKS